MILMSTQNLSFYHEAILMSTHNIVFYEEMTKINFQLSSNIIKSLLLVSTYTVVKFLSTIHFDMSHFTRKPVLGVSDQF